MDEKKFGIEVSKLVNSLTNPLMVLLDISFGLIVIEMWYSVLSSPVFCFPAVFLVLVSSSVFLFFARIRLRQWCRICATVADCWIKT